MSGLPYPTKDRLKLAAAIAAGKVRHYPFQEPKTFNDITGGIVTSKVQLMLSAGLVEVPEPPAEHNYSVVRLTPEGMAWVTRARTAELLDEEITARLTAAGLEHFKISTGEGPVSTSPETGPPPGSYAAPCPDECGEDVVWMPAKGGAE